MAKEFEFYSNKTEQPSLSPDEVKSIAESVLRTQNVGQQKLIGGTFQSANFKTGVQGWQLLPNGDIEANSGTFRGALQANSIDIPDAATANSFHVESDGDTWWGATTFATALASISKAGEAIFTNARIWFGGNGSDGALALTSGATNIDLTGLKTFIKNYTSISITGTGALTFTNPHNDGTTIILKSQGAVTITTSATRAIDLRSLGGAGGAGGAAWTSTFDIGGAEGSGLGGGFSSLIGTINAGVVGGQGGGGGGSLNKGADGTIQTTVAVTVKTKPFGGRSLSGLSANASRAEPGGGGGGGTGGGNNTTGGTGGGAGGRGGGALVIECAGALNITGTIDSAGANGTNGGANANGDGGGGGGGAGGKILILYKTLTANTGTYTVTGGTGGTGGGTVGQGAGAGGNGSAGESLVALNVGVA